MRRPAGTGVLCGGRDRTPTGTAQACSSVIVERHHRQKGVGTLLLEEVVARGRNNDLLRLQLLADQDSVPALTFYGKNAWSSKQLACLRRRP